MNTSVKLLISSAVLVVVGAIVMGNGPDSMSQLQRYGFGVFIGGATIFGCSYGWILRSNCTDLNQTAPKDINIKTS